MLTYVGASLYDIDDTSDDARDKGSAEEEKTDEDDQAIECA